MLEVKLRVNWKDFLWKDGVFSFPWMGYLGRSWRLLEASSLSIGSSAWAWSSTSTPAYDSHSKVKFADAICVLGLQKISLCMCVCVRMSDLF